MQPDIIEIDKKFPQITIAGKSIPFTKREFDVFLFLYENQGRICTRHAIHESIWGYEHYAYNRIIDDIILRIRKKLKALELDSKLVTKRGFGYSFTN